MGTLQRTIICPTVGSKEVAAHRTMVSECQPRRSGFQACKYPHRQRVCTGILTRESHGLKHMTVCRAYRSSNGNGSRAEKFNESDEDYINSSVLEAVEVKSGSDGFVFKMRDGKFMKCVHNNPQGGYLPDCAPHPAIVLKMEDDSRLVFPIIVSEMPSVILMAALRNVHHARPTMYQVAKEMTEKMGYQVKLVRITERVDDAYLAQLYMSKACRASFSEFLFLFCVVKFWVGNEADSISFDLRPSDAINIAVICKVPIQVNKYLVQDDGMRILEDVKSLNHGLGSDGLLFSEAADRPSGPSLESTEFNLLRNMIVAADEERYNDAARWRDELTRLRAKRNWA
ncbi:Bifunctional nuclease 1-like protein [Drosera capensis]